MADIWILLFGWLPSWVQIVILVLIALAMLILVIRAVAAILDAVPFFEG